MLQLFIILFCSSNLALASIYVVPPECNEAKRCGEIENISYPFSLKDRPYPSHCDYPDSLQLECINNPNGFTSLILPLANYSFNIQKIFYGNNSLVVDMQSYYNDDACKIATQNLSSHLFSDGNKPLRISNQNMQLYLFNCTSLHPTQNHPQYKHVDECYSTTLIAHVEGNYRENPKPDETMLPFHCHQTVTLPVLNNSTILNKNYIIDLLELVSNGFLVEWRYCSQQECEERKEDCSDHNNSSCVCSLEDYFTTCSESRYCAFLVYRLTCIYVEKFESLSNNDKDNYVIELTNTSTLDEIGRSR